LCSRSRSESSTGCRSARTGRTRSRVVENVTKNSTTASAATTATAAVQLADGPAHGRKAFTSASTASTTAMLPAAAKVILNAASTVRSCGSADMTPSSAA